MLNYPSFVNTGALPDDMLMNFKTMISQRQIDRLWVVGFNNSGSIIDSSYEGTQILEKHFTKFILLGKDPHQLTLHFWTVFTISEL